MLPRSQKWLDFSFLWSHHAVPTGGPGSKGKLLASAPSSAVGCFWLTTVMREKGVSTAHGRWSPFLEGTQVPQLDGNRVALIQDDPGAGVPTAPCIVQQATGTAPKPLLEA